MYYNLYNYRYAKKYDIPKLIVQLPTFIVHDDT